MKTDFLVFIVGIGSLLFLHGCTSKENMIPAEPGDIGVPGVTYQAPILITKGGTYTGNYKSTDSNIPAIWVLTNEPVEITGSIIVSAGDMIRCGSGTRLNIHHNSLFGLTPAPNFQWGRALNDYQPHDLLFQNNYVEHSGGLLVDHTEVNATTMVIKYNIIRNTDKRRADLSPGEKRTGIMFNTVAKITGEISWNQFINLPGASSVDDNIYMFNSGGTNGSPFLIHDNYIKGAYPYPLTAGSYVGSGITVDGDPGSNTMEKMSQFINAYNNQVISTCNAGMNLAAGHDIHYYNNTIISSGKYPDGTRSDRFWGGVCMWNASNVPAENFINNTIKANTIGYVRPGKYAPIPGRQDWVVVAGSPISVSRGDNVALKNPITLETEKAEWPKWQQKLADNKIVLGNVVK